MDWRGRRGSNNIEDRRSQGGGQRGGRGASVGGLGLVAVLVIGYFLGIDVTPLLQGIDGAGQQTQPTELTNADIAAGEFVSVTLADTEQVWTRVLQQQLGRTYHPATLVLFKGVTPSACGGASGATGPFYCPGDKKVYLDTDFFTTMERQLGARGDFAAAYVVAHEIGHHVQDELGILSKANALRQQVSEADSNAISVRIELQADCLSGIWAREAEDTIGSVQPGDIREAVDAAKRIGDDTLQRNAGRTPMPDNFTHGTSEQRSRWFVTGYEEGQIAACDTFSGDQL